MNYAFKAKIYKTGINWCVDVPQTITAQMIAVKGRISIRGKISGFDFAKTLTPVKNAAHRLFVKAAMMKGGKTALGKMATFEIEQAASKIVREYPVPKQLQEQMKKYNLANDFDNLTKSKKRDILKYLNYVKTEETSLKNIDKLIRQLKNKDRDVRIP